MVNLKKSVLPIRLDSGSGQAHPGEVGGPDLENRISSVLDKLLSETIHVPDRLAHGKGETGALRSPTHETYLVAPKEQLPYSRVARKDYFNSKVSSSTSDLVVKAGECHFGASTCTPFVMPFRSLQTHQMKVGAFQ